MSVDEKIDQLVILAKELVLKHKIPQKVLYKKITKNLIENINEKQYVLYNTSFCEFAVSKQFSEFSGMDSSSIAKSRENMRDIIISFGKHVANKYPLLVQMINTYYQNNLSAQTSICTKYKYILDKKDKLSFNYNLLKKLDKTTKISKDIYTSTFRLETEINCIDKIIARNGENDLNKLIKHVEDKLNKYDQELLEIEKEIDYDILKHIDYQFPEEVEDNKLSFYLRIKWSNYSFLDAIEHYGLEHFAIWKCQSMFNEKAMRYLLITRKFNDNKVIDKKLYESLGLIAASAQNISLTFKEIPIGLSWSISEYDGKESIYID